MATKRNYTPPTGIDLYVLLTQKTNADGTLLTGRWRNTYWVNGVSLNVYSEEEAMNKRRLGLASDYKVFKTIPFDEISEWAKENNLKEVPHKKYKTLTGGNENYPGMATTKQPY